MLVMLGISPATAEIHRFDAPSTSGQIVVQRKSYQSSKERMNGSMKYSHRGPACAHPRTPGDLIGRMVVSFMG
jgi:hypothetical protein